MKSKSPLYKGSLKLIILKMLEDNGKMYGYEITQKAKELTAGEVDITEGALYPALHKMEADGQLTVSIATVGNRKRKYYDLTAEGEEESVRLMDEFRDFVQNMNNILTQNVNPSIS